MKKTKEELKNIINITIKDKLFIGEFIPKNGNELTMMLAKDLIDKVKLNDKDIKDGNVKSNGNGITWNKDYIPEPIELTEPEISLLKQGREKLNKEEKINLDNLELSIKISRL